MRTEPSRGRTVPDEEEGPLDAVGERYVDAGGDLSDNPADGANFTKLNGQGGVVMLPDAQRAFDSREEFADPPNTDKGRFAAGETRAIDLSEFTDLPADANGAVINLTVSGTGQPGYLTVFNGDTADDDRPNASSINWYAPGAVVANGIPVVIGTGGIVKVYALQETEVIVDVSADVPRRGELTQVLTRSRDAARMPAVPLLTPAARRGVRSLCGARPAAGRERAYHVRSAVLSEPGNQAGTELAPP